VESRLAHGPSKRHAIVRQALNEDLFSPGLCRGFGGLRKNRLIPIRFYFVTWWADRPGPRDKRLSMFNSRRKRAVKKSGNTRLSPGTRADRCCQDAQERRIFTASGTLGSARLKYLRCAGARLGTTGCMQKRYYGLARIAALQKDPDSPRNCFKKLGAFLPTRHHVVGLSILGPAGGCGPASVNRPRRTTARCWLSTARLTQSRKAAEKGLAQPSIKTSSPPIIARRKFSNVGA